jgi:hypothetical protein
MITPLPGVGDGPYIPTGHPLDPETDDDLDGWDDFEEDEDTEDENDCND